MTREHKPSCLGAMSAAAQSQQDLLVRTFDAVTDNCVALSNNSSSLTPTQQDLFTQCTDIITSKPGDAQDQATLATIDDENPGVGTNAAEASVAQIQTLRDRLYAIREGSSGIQVAGLGLGTMRNGLVEDSASGSDADIPRLGGFVNGLGFFGDQRQRGEQAAYDFSGGGVTVGADYRFGDNLVAGLAFGWIRRNSDFTDRSEFQSDSYSPSIYASYFGDAFYVNGIFTYTRTNHDLDRAIVYNVGGGPVNRTAKSDPSANEYAVSVGGGYEWTFGEFSVGPSAQLNYVHWDLESFTETGAGGLNLQNGSQDLNSFTSVIGGDASYAFSTDIGIILPQIRAGWVHEYSNNSRTIGASFVSQPFAPMNVVTSKPDRDYATFGATVSGTFAHGWSAFLDYETLLDLSQVSINTFTIGARLEF